MHYTRLTPTGQGPSCLDAPMLRVFSEETVVRDEETLVLATMIRLQQAVRSGDPARIDAVQLELDDLGYMVIVDLERIGGGR